MLSDDLNPYPIALQLGADVSYTVTLSTAENVRVDLSVNVPIAIPIFDVLDRPVGAFDWAIGDQTQDLQHGVLRFFAVPVDTTPAPTMRGWYLRNLPPITYYKIELRTPSGRKLAYNPSQVEVIR